MAMAKVYKLQEFQDILYKNVTLPDCDFGGKTIKGLTALEPYLMRIEPFKVDSLTFDNKSQSYDITKIAHGMIIDIVKVLSKACNFNFEIHLGKEIDKYGTFSELPNGTIQGSGLFEYFSNASEFDMIFADLNYSPQRMKHMHYLPAFSGMSIDFE